MSYCQLKISQLLSKPPPPLALATLPSADAGPIPAAPRRLSSCQHCTWQTPAAFSPEHATHPSSQALVICQVTQGQRQKPGRGAVIASAKLWGAGSCCLEPPRRALSPRGSPQGQCLYLPKPGKVGGASELGLRWTVT